MFTFDFEIEEEENQIQFPSLPSKRDTAGSSTTAEYQAVDKSCHHLTLDDLMKTLPDAISYSPLHHPSLDTPVLRRDLFDARFQLINRDFDDLKDSRTNQEEEYVDAKTDLIPGLYEGGLKSWEGGVDLVEVLCHFVNKRQLGDGQDNALGEWVQGGKLLEIGCGTALPTAYLLRCLLSSPFSSTNHSTIFHLQDYNLLVLSLVTLPNLILASLPFLPPEVLRLPEEGDEPIETVVPDLEEPGNLSLHSGLLDAFKALLDERRIELRFTYGHWEGLSKELAERKEGYGLVLTAETIYSQENTPALVKLLREAVKEPHVIKHNDIQLESSLEDLKVNDSWSEEPLRNTTSGSVLVAAKILYFGVGGGLQDFLEVIKTSGAHYSTVKEWTQGVGRKVVQVAW
ncbi:hypothetical protein L204_105112 [Cryptococcus depauperatus]|nr:hypothetical protein L204_03760 [Cryptococcus depauperatus CBS 7855]